MGTLSGVQGERGVAMAYVHLAPQTCKVTPPTSDELSKGLQGTKLSVQSGTVMAAAVPNSLMPVAAPAVAASAACNHASSRPGCNDASIH